MSIYIIVAISICSIAVGFIIAWNISKNKYKKSRSSFLSSINNLASQKDQMEEMVGQIRSQYEIEKDKNIDLNKNIAALEATKKASTGSN